MSSALEQIHCAGVQTNERWLSRVLRAPQFLQVHHSIAFLQERAGDFAGPADIGPSVVALAAIAAHGPLGDPGAAPSGAPEGFTHANARATPASSASGGATPAAAHTNPWAILDGFTPNLPARVEYQLFWHGHAHSAELTFNAGRLSSVTLDDQSTQSVSDLSFSGVRRAGVGPCSLPGPTSDRFSVCIGNVRLAARYLTDGARLHLWTSDGHFEVMLEDPRLKEFSATAAQGGLTTPLPGVVAAVVAKVGQAVRAGDVLMVIEAMKMEHSIRAPYDGSVKAIHFAHGDRVPEGSQLLELAPATNA